MKDEIQVTMTTQHNSRSKTISIAKALRTSTLLLCMTLLTFYNFATANTTKVVTDSNITDFNSTLEIGDDFKNVKISMPDTKLFRRADREINRNMAIEVRNMKYFKLNQPESNTADFLITNDFYNQFKLVDFYTVDQFEDDKTTSEFHAYNLNINFSIYIKTSDNELNKDFFEIFKINPLNDYSDADAEINFNFQEVNN